MLLVIARALAAGTTRRAVTRRIPTVLIDKVTTRPRRREKAYFKNVTPVTWVEAKVSSMPTRVNLSKLTIINVDVTMSKRKVMARSVLFIRRMSP